MVTVLGWCLSSCTPEGVEHTPDPPLVTTTSVGAGPPTTTPPEPPTVKAGDYIKLTRAESILFWQSSTNVGLVAGAQALSNAGWRDPLRVLARCPWAFEGDQYMGMSRDDASAFWETGAALTRRAEDNFIPRLVENAVNRRCDVDHPQHHPDFCKVNNIRKTVYSPFGALGDVDTPRGEFWKHLDRANAMRNRAGRCRNAIRDAGGKTYDSIAGWCTAMNQLSWRSEDCPT